MACSGTPIRLIERGWEVHIATVTAGDLGSVDEPPADAARTRRAEGEAATAMVDATSHCIGEPDGRVMYDRAALNKSIDLFRRAALR